MHPSNQERGFTILLAALVASLVLSLGISVFSIAQKQIVLAGTGRNSQYAFYAADAAAECALYWDVRKDFASTTDPAETIECDQSTADVAHETQGGEDIFTFEYMPSGYCAKVTVRKRQVPLPGERWRTLIRADGYAPAVECQELENSSRILQRSVELSY
nr:hypothetical protein [uncultured bacterium]